MDTLNADTQNQTNSDMYTGTLKWNTKLLYLLATQYWENETILRTLEA